LIISYLYKVMLLGVLTQPIQMPAICIAFILYIDILKAKLLGL
jgi:hypothetical protein